MALLPIVIVVRKKFKFAEIKIIIKTKKIMAKKSGIYAYVLQSTIHKDIYIRGTDVMLSVDYCDAKKIYKL